MTSCLSVCVDCWSVWWDGGAALWTTASHVHWWPISTAHRGAVSGRRRVNHHWLYWSQEIQQGSTVCQILRVSVNSAYPPLWVDMASCQLLKLRRADEWFHKVV